MVTSVIPVTCPSELVVIWGTLVALPLDVYAVCAVNGAWNASKVPFGVSAVVVVEPSKEIGERLTLLSVPTVAILVPLAIAVSAVMVPAFVMLPWVCVEEAFPSSAVLIVLIRPPMAFL